MPNINILNTQILYSPSDAADSDTGSTDSAPFGPGYDPLGGINLGLNPPPRTPRTPSNSAVLTAPSAMADMSPSQAPGQGIAPLPAGDLGALGVLEPFAGADSPVPSWDFESQDPTPFGPGYDPLGGINLGLNPPPSTPRTPSNSAVLTAPSAMADMSPSQAPGQGIAPLPAGGLEKLGVLRAFAGAASPLTPSGLDASDPGGGPSYDPQLQQLINELSGLNRPAPHSEPIQTSRNTSWHHVRIDP